MRDVGLLGGVEFVFPFAPAWEVAVVLRKGEFRERRPVHGLEEIQRGIRAIQAGPCPVHGFAVAAGESLSVGGAVEVESTPRFAGKGIVRDDRFRLRGVLLFFLAKLPCQISQRLLLLLGRRRERQNEAQQRRQNSDFSTHDGLLFSEPFGRTNDKTLPAIFPRGVCPPL